MLAAMVVFSLIVAVPDVPPRLSVVAEPPMLSVVVCAVLKRLTLEPDVAETFPPLTTRLLAAVIAPAPVME